MRSVETGRPTSSRSTASSASSFGVPSSSTLPFVSTSSGPRILNSTRRFYRRLPQRATSSTASRPRYLPRFDPLGARYGNVTARAIRGACTAAGRLAPTARHGGDRGRQAPCRFGLRGREGLGGEQRHECGLCRRPRDERCGASNPIARQRFPRPAVARRRQQDALGRRSDDRDDLSDRRERTSGSPGQLAFRVVPRGSSQRPAPSGSRASTHLASTASTHPHSRCFAPTRSTGQPGSTSARIAWIVNHRLAAVSRVDPGTGQIVARIHVRIGHESIFEGPERVLAADGAVWVSHPAQDTITRIDPRRNAIVERIHLPRRSQPYLLAAGDGSIWASGSTSVFRVDPHTNRVVASIPVGDTRDPTRAV